MAHPVHNTRAQDQHQHTHARISYKHLILSLSLVLFLTVFSTGITLGAAPNLWIRLPEYLTSLHSRPTNPAEPLTCSRGFRFRDCSQPQLQYQALSDDRDFKYDDTADSLVNDSEFAKALSECDKGDLEQFFEVKGTAETFLKVWRTPRPVDHLHITKFRSKTGSETIHQNPKLKTQSNNQSRDVSRISSVNKARGNIAFARCESLFGEESKKSPFLLPLLDGKDISSLAETFRNPISLFEYIQTWFFAFDFDGGEHLFTGLTSEEAILLINIIENLIVTLSLTLSSTATEIVLCQSWIRKLCRTFTIFPPSIILIGVEFQASFSIKCGGYSDIYKGTYKGLTVALKVPRTDGTIQRTKRMHSEIIHEALHWTYLTHKNITPFLGVVRDLTCPRIALVTPWMSNGTILQYLENNPDTCRLSLLAQSASGLKYLHERNPPMIHGDIKAANILIDDEGSARLSDFGLITLSEVEGNAFQVTQGPDGGSTRWMSPELIMGSTKRSKESDVYAFGMTVVEVYTGLPPFTGKYSNDAQVVFAVCSGAQPERESMLGASLESACIPDEVWNLAGQCWNVESARRPTIQQIERGVPPLVMTFQLLSTLII